MPAQLSQTNESQ